MKYIFDAQEFGKRIKIKRVIDLNIGVREVEKQSKVSASTISRVENGKLPELQNLILLCNWLGESPSFFFKIKSKK